MTDPTWLVVYWVAPHPGAPNAPPMVCGPFPTEDDAWYYLAEHPGARPWAGAVYWTEL